MEDAHTTVLELDPEKRNAFFAVFDGHGGSAVAKFSGENVYQRLAAEESYTARDYELALKKAFLGTDEDLRANPAFFHDPSGCAAVAALFTDDKRILVANAGDSRSVLAVKGEAKPLSFDHKPSNDSEIKRIKAAGGFVDMGRVNGNLALSRAIGDFEFKKNHSLPPEEQVVTSDPEITGHERTDEDEFLIIACDGIWDCLSSQQVIDVVRRQIAERKELSEICEMVMDKCCAPDADIGAGVGCDNMTIMIIAILNGKTKDQYYDWMAKRVEEEYGYPTPKEFPELYDPARIAMAQNRARTGGGGGGLGGFRIGPPALGLVARSLVAGGGLSGGLGAGISSDMFDDSDDTDEDNEEEGSGWFWNANNSLGASLSNHDEHAEGQSAEGDLEMADGTRDQEKKNSAMIGLAAQQPTTIGSPLVPSPKLQHSEETSDSTPINNHKDTEAEKPTIQTGA
jgi:protein phosphatase 2C family protein 2/3